MNFKNATAQARHWFLVDKVLFEGEQPKAKIASGEDYHAYLDLKHHMISNLVALMEHSGVPMPEVDPSIGSKGLLESAATEAKRALSEAAVQMGEPDFKADVESRIKLEMDSSATADPESVAVKAANRIHRRAALDYALVAGPLKESGVVLKTDTKGGLLLEAHKRFCEALMAIAWKSA